MTTLQERLRAFFWDSPHGDEASALCVEAADEIARLTADVAALGTQCGNMLRANERLTAERDAAREDLIPFVIIWAVQYAKDYGLPDGHLHPTHYDILDRAGARLVDFTRAIIEDIPCAPI